MELELEHGVRSIEYGLWSVEYGAWSMEYGLWSMELELELEPKPKPKPNQKTISSIRPSAFASCPSFVRPLAVIVYAILCFLSPASPVPSDI